MRDVGPEKRSRFAEVRSAASAASVDLAPLGRLRPFFCYFGGKWTLAPRYPVPEHDRIVEPFAGSAGYATRYADREVVLVERAPVVAALWRWLIRVSADEVEALPLDVTAASLARLSAEARSLILFWCARGRTAPARAASSWMTQGRYPLSFWGETIRARIARQVSQIRHWRVIEGDYTAAPDVTATWFVDPPYVGGVEAGKRQRHYLARVDDYTALGRWTRGRRGLVIVCEQSGADWLPFVPFRGAKSIARESYKEHVFVCRSTTERD